jgi:hypothetical protein
VLVAVPFGVVTPTGPLVAPAGTVAVICTSLSTRKLAPVPLKSTTVAPVKPLPVMVTEVPTRPLAGLKPLIEGDRVTVKLPVLVPVPLGLVTSIGPLVAPAGTVAVICTSLSTVKLAVVPLKSTAVAPVKPLPVMVTEVPTGPLAGLKPLTAGGSVTVKLPVLVAVPFGVVTPTGPLVAPAGTVAVIWLSLSTRKLAAVPLKSTVLAPVKPLPAIVTLVPTGPLAGLKPLTAGGGATVKLVLLVPVPLGLVTSIGPLVAPGGTVAVIWLSESTVKLVAPVPLKSTAVAPVKPLPVMVTEVPTGPLEGLKPLIEGGTVTVKLLELVLLPFGVVTSIGPVVAPTGTVAVICTLLLTVKPAAAMPSNVTADAFFSHCPLMTTVLPTGPLDGLKPLIEGTFVGGAETPDDGRPRVVPIETTTTSARAVRRRQHDPLRPASAKNGWRCRLIVSTGIPL